MNNDEMKAVADNLWNYLEPRVQELIGSCVRFYRAQVVEASNNGKITIQKPFDNTPLALPYVSAMENAEVGSQVTVFVMGSNGHDANNSVIVNDGAFSK